jgi:predicted dehydrogenase
MNFAVIGIGKWGKNYLKSLKEINKASVISVCSKNRMTFENLPEDFKSVEWFDDYKKAINENIDTVIIATHPDSHFEIAKFALENNKNVICEKPCMFSEEQYQIIQNLTKQNNKIFFTNYINLFHSICEEIRATIKNGKDWHWIDINNTGDGPIRENYSDLWDYGSHIISVILYILDCSDIAINNYAKDKDGNHVLCISYKDKRIYATFGNKSKERRNSIKLTTPDQSIEWIDKKNVNVLKIMLENFIDLKLNSNYNLSRNISSILETLKINE